jgi:hypothetical protein
MPPAPLAQNVGWDQWLQQEGERVEENELQVVNNLANVVVVNAMAVGIMQHPDVPQDSHSISSETTSFSELRGSLQLLNYLCLKMVLLRAPQQCRIWKL